VYVLGAVNRPGGYIMQDEGSLTAEAALALAYGTAPQAAINKIRVIRKCGDGTCMLEIGAQYEQVPQGTSGSVAVAGRRRCICAIQRPHIACGIKSRAWPALAASAVIYVYR